VVARQDYLPFGEEIPAGYAGRSSSLLFGASDGVEQKFTGQIRDSETGLDFFAARYYASAVGRFTSPDPMNLGADPTDPQTWNAYAYVRNNPLALVDPMGLCHMGADNVAYDDEPGDCGGGSVTVTAQAPEEIPLIWVSFPSGGPADQGQQVTPSPQLTESLLGAVQPAKNGMLTIKQKFCVAIPDARTMTIDIGIGGLGSVHGAVTATLDYKTGLTSFSASGGFLGGWNGVFSTSFSSGYVYGSSNTNVSTNYSAGSAISGYYSKSGGSREIGISVGWGVLGKYSLGVGKYESTASIGKVPGLMLPMDNLLMFLKQVCQ
jgi:RHS repeat-associated protein